MTDDKTLLLKMHPYVQGLDDDAVQDIANASELLRFKSEDVVHRANEPVAALDLVIHGRLSLNFVDLQGTVFMRSQVAAGGQYGALSAALSGSAPIECVAEDPTTLLRIDYQVSLELGRKYESFRLNLLRDIAESVKQTLFQSKDPLKPRLVTVYHQSPITRPLIRKLIKRLSDLGENPCVLTDDPGWEPIESVRFRQAISSSGEELSESDVRRQIHAWSDSQRIIIDVAVSEFSLDHVTLEASNLVLWCVTPKDWQKSVGKLKKLLSDAPGWRDKICVVWLLDQEPVAPLAKELTSLAKRDIKVAFSKPGPGQGRLLGLGFERLVHLVRGVQIGVALGGGGARGMAHLGVLKALEENGIIVDMIAGTSAGAMTGTVYASGLEPDYSIGRFVNDLRPSWFFRHVWGGENWFLIYKYRRGQFDPMLRKYLNDHQLQQLPVPMASVTVDLISGQVVIRDDGDATHGIIESINLPLLSLPVMRRGQALVDGGLINNVPADVLASKGCNFIIAVNVTGKMELEFAGNRSDTPPANIRPPTTMQTAWRTYLVQSASTRSHGVRPADIVIEPDLTEFAMTEFVRTDELAAVGEQTTCDAIPKIKNLLAKMDPQLFAPTDKPGLSN